MGKFTAFKVQLKSLPQGIHEFEYHLDKTFFANMESTDIHDADIRVHLTLNYKADIYDLAFKIDGDVTLLCDRCLDDLHFPIDTAYHIAVKYGDDYDDSSDDLLVIPESDNYLNVAYMLYDTVALSIPLKHVHPAGKCNRQMSAMLKNTPPAAEKMMSLPMNSSTRSTTSKWNSKTEATPQTPGGTH